MTTKGAEALLIKIFIGLQLSPDLRIQLKNSPEWKESRILAGQEQNQLSEVRFSGKDYLGFIVDSAFCSWVDLQKKQTNLKQSLAKYCPQLNIDSVKIILFSQIYAV